MSFKDTKRCLFKFSPYECTAVEEYLEEMAQKGWSLQSATMSVLKFKRIEPKKIKYSVDVLHKVSSFDSENTDLKLEYREYCEAAGWKYLCEGENGKIQVFYTEDIDKAVPIHTDQEEKFKSVIKASLSSVLYQLIIILMLIVNISIQLFISGTEYALSTNIGVFSLVIMSFCIVINTIGIFNFFVWAIRAKIRLKQNKFMPYNGYKQLKIKNIFNKIFILIGITGLLLISIFNNNESKGFIASVLVILGISLIIVIGTKLYINKKSFSRNTNRTITVIVNLISIYLIVTLVGFFAILSVITNKQDDVKTENVSLLLSDFGYNDYTNTHIDHNESIIAKRTQYFLTDNSNDLNYTIFQSKYPLVINFDENRLVNKLNIYGFDVKQDGIKLDNNIKVYSSSDKKTYVLVSQYKVVEVQKHFDVTSEAEFLNMVYKRLFSNN